MSSAVSIQTNEVKGGLPPLSLSPDILSEGIAVYAMDELTNNVHMIFMSETARNILGLSQETVLPAPLSALGLYADDESRYEMKLKEAFVSRSGFVMVQHLKHPDGNEHFRSDQIPFLFERVEKDEVVTIEDLVAMTACQGIALDGEEVIADIDIFNDFVAFLTARGVNV